MFAHSRKRLFLMTVVLALVMAMFLVIPVLAAPVGFQVEEPTFDFGAFLQSCTALFATLVGINQFIMFLVNFLKMVKVVPDGGGESAYKLLNGLAFALLLAQQLFLPAFDVLQIDKIAGLLAQLGSIVVPALIAIAFPAVMWLGEKAYQAWRGFPVLGYSYSAGGMKALFSKNG